MIARWLLGAALVATPLPVAEDAATGAGPNVSTVATRDVVYFHPSYPVFLRLHIQVDQASFDAAWLEYVGSVFRQIDTDQDGRVKPDETQAKVGKLTGEAASIVRMRNLWMADDDPFDRAITLPEFTRFLVENGRGPFQPPTEPVAAPTNNEIGSSLFEQLDIDQDRRLSAEEFSRAGRTMRRHDLDDDGAFSTSELSPIRQNRLVGRVRTASEAVPAAFTTLVPGRSSATLLGELIRRYRDGTNPANSDLRASDLGIDKERFARFDADASGSLDHDELRRLVKDPPPTLELMIRIGSRDESAAAVETISSSRQSVSVRSTGQLTSVVLENVQIEIGQVTSDLNTIRRSLAQQFKNADRDNNKYLEEEETGQHPVFNLSFGDFDINGDGKVFEEEMNKVIDARSEIARTRTRMSIRNRGRDLFQILDADRNLQLSERELTRASRRIELWDNDADGKVDSAEVPQIFQLSLGPGVPVFRGLRVLGQATAARDADPRSTGPVWFQKMDRNNDGELSRREFPGSRVQFQELDSDNNGIVDTLEAAEAAPASLRPKQEE